MQFSPRGHQGDFIFARVFIALFFLVSVTAQGFDFCRFRNILGGTTPPRIDREGSVARLENEEFDVLIVGGGSAGAGAAAEAASRGLKVAMIESDDFASGTSSRSTKILHGGVRYLEAAVKNFDLGQLQLVIDALHERNNALRNAPQLSRPLPTFIPLYKTWQIPYMWFGMKVYDLLAGRKSTLPGSRYVGRKEALELYPGLNPDKLKGGIMYHDGQFDDSRLNVSLALTAAQDGAAVANYVGLVGLNKTGGKVTGAQVRDGITGKTFNVKAKVVINATGPFSDNIRQMDDPSSRPLVKASSGTHIILPESFSPPASGLLIPKTDDGRVLFVLPWNGKTLVGTTDNPSNITVNPKATEDDIKFILEQMSKYYKPPPKREDILSHWTGLRPLVADPNAKDTKTLSRDHVIMTSDSGLVTIVGGKWTTYRKMGEEVINTAIAQGGLTPQRPSVTARMPIAGGAGYTKELPAQLTRDHGVPKDVAEYLSHAYGDRATYVATLTKEFPKRLSEKHPYLEAEVIYAVHVESARTAQDVLERRMRMGFLDREEAMKSIPRVVELMGDALKWDAARRDKERTDAERYMKPAF